MEIKERIHFGEFLTWLAIGLVAVCVIGLMDNGQLTDPVLEQTAWERDSLLSVVRRWEIKEEFREDFITEFTFKIRELKKSGHRPDSSLVFSAMVEFLKWPSMTWEDLDSMYRKETGWGRDKRRGMFGEITLAQIDTNTFKETLRDLGFEIISFNWSEYHNVVTSNEMATLYIMRQKMIRDGKFEHVVYFNGFYTKIKQYNTSKFDLFIKKKKGKR